MLVTFFLTTAGLIFYFILKPTTETTSVNSINKARYTAMKDTKVKSYV